MQINLSMHGSRTDIIKQLKTAADILKVAADEAYVNIAPPGQPYRITCAPDGGVPGGPPKAGVKVIGLMADGSMKIVSRKLPAYRDLALLPTADLRPEDVMEHWIDEHGEPCAVSTWCYLPVFAEPTTPSET